MLCETTQSDADNHFLNCIYSMTPSSTKSTLLYEKGQVKVSSMERVAKDEKSESAHVGGGGMSHHINYGSNFL